MIEPLKLYYTKKSPSNSKFLERLPIGIIFLILFTSGLNNLESSFEYSTYFSILNFVSSIIVLFTLIKLDYVKEKLGDNFNNYNFKFSGIVSLIDGYGAFLSGSTYIPYIYYSTGLFYYIFLPRIFASVTLERELKIFDEFILLQTGLKKEVKIYKNEISEVKIENATLFMQLKNDKSYKLFLIDNDLENEIVLERLK